MTLPSVHARIYTESGGWGLPTIDADGLAAIALLRFADIPFSISQGASRSMTAANVLPVVVFHNSNTSEPSVCAGLASLIALFTADLTLPDPNAHLTPFMIAESTAFATLVTARFAPARLHEFFVDDRNYDDIYHTLLEKETGFPLNRVIPFLRRRQIKAEIRDQPSDSLMFDAGIALTALSTRLGDRGKYFYGDKPSVLDAIVFGYLASVMYVPLPNGNLRGQIANFGNLVSFVSRIRQTFFARDGDLLIGELNDEEIVAEARRQALRREEPVEDDKLSNEEKEKRRWNNYFIWGSVAAFAAHVLLGSEMEIDFD